VRALAAVLQEWIEQSDDFPAAYRVRDDDTDRITGVQFTTRIPPLRNPDVPPPDERWGRQGGRDSDQPGEEEPNPWTFSAPLETHR